MNEEFRTGLLDPRDLDPRDVAKIEALINDQRDSLLYAALSRAQGKFPPIPRNRTVTVQTKSGRSYTFDYAPLETILDCVRDSLAAEGLALSQPLVSAADKTFLKTVLLHKDGGELSSVMEIPNAQARTPQEFGSILTYLRRYCVQSLLGIATEEDDDANSAEGNTITARQERAVQQREGARPPSGGREQPQEPPQAPVSAAPASLTAKERWERLSLAEAKAKPAEITDPNLLRQILIYESERQAGSRKTVLTAVSARIKELEGEPKADDDAAARTVSQAGGPTESAEPLQEALRVKAALAFIQENPTVIENSKAWTVTGVLTGLSEHGQGVFGSLEEVPAETLTIVWDAVPNGVRDSVLSLGPENLTKLAGQAK